MEKKKRGADSAPFFMPQLECSQLQYGAWGTQFCQV